MSTLVSNLISDYSDALCYMDDAILGTSKAWVTFNINSGVVTLNTAFNISSVQDLGVGLYKGVSSVTLPGSNGSRAVAMGYSGNDTVTGFQYKGALFDGTSGSTGIRCTTGTETTTQFVQGVIF